MKFRFGNSLCAFACVMGIITNYVLVINSFVVNLNFLLSKQNSFLQILSTHDMILINLINLERIYIYS